MTDRTATQPAAAPEGPQLQEGQITASDPDLSAWVSANAGTGKTFVLVNRVCRLLLSGTAPDRILCLTYTKAAAAEMTNRLFETLAGWTALDDEALRRELVRIGVRAPADDDLGAARRLFARALEAPGGLKVQTIHAFCERLLHRFPLEANVPPNFEVLDERGSAALIEDSLMRVLERATGSDAALGEALGTLVALADEGGLKALVTGFLSARDAFALQITEHGDTAALETVLRDRLGLGPDATAERLCAGLMGAADAALIETAAEALRQGKTTDQGRSEHLRRAARCTDGEARLAALWPALLTQDGTPRKQLMTKGVAEANPGLLDAVMDLAQRTQDIARDLRSLRVATASAALMCLADDILDDYRARKLAMARLDYDDLITRTAQLLVSADAAAWVLYKLDGGIDHILIDEAQDTSPLQWQVVERLAEEFFSGAGARQIRRTVFAVGDEKQSIYSFQGAAPKLFPEKGRAFRRQVEAVSEGWRSVPLNTSFRSAKSVLEAVDLVFGTPEALTGVSEVPVTHTANRDDIGLVELWPLVERDAGEDEDVFGVARAQPAPATAEVRLAGRIAATIAGWLAAGTVLPGRGGGRPIRARDILILLRKRGGFAETMIRALKDQGLPVAGADRMQLQDQLAVMDLMALADVMLLPEDDLTLACLLKSPLVGLTDDDLFQIGYGRTGALIHALRAKSEERPRWREALTRLNGWLARADFVPPFDFFSDVLAHGDTRARLLSYLGPEAGDAIDAFLDLTLQFEAENPPSLQGFMAFLRGGETELKRDMEQRADEVRVMTVHGAKGLESPIVFVPDMCSAPSPAHLPRLLELEDAAGPPGTPGVFAWRLGEKPEPGPIAYALERAKLDQDEEYRRLLYVAMTRAEDWLFLCGFEVSGSLAGSWYGLAERALKPYMAEHETAAGPVWRLGEGDPHAYERPAEPGAVGTAGHTPRPLPGWAHEPPQWEPAEWVPAQPSTLGEVAATGAAPLADARVLSPLSGEDDARFLRGRLIHRLLEVLPGIAPTDRRSAGRQLVARQGAPLDSAAGESLVDEVLAILDDPALAELFGPGSLAEVPIVARLERGADIPPLRLSGQIDRLVVTPTRLFIVDYKTNRPAPRDLDQVAPAYIRQLAAYRAALRPIYPDREIVCHLLWTDGPRLMRIPDDRIADILGPA